MTHRLICDGCDLDIDSFGLPDSWSKLARPNQNASWDLCGTCSMRVIEYIRELAVRCSLKPHEQPVVAT